MQLRSNATNCFIKCFYFFSNQLYTFYGCLCSAAKTLWLNLLRSDLVCIWGYWLLFLPRFPKLPIPTGPSPALYYRLKSKVHPRPKIPKSPELEAEKVSPLFSLQKANKRPQGKQLRSQSYRERSLTLMGNELLFERKLGPLVLMPFFFRSPNCKSDAPLTVCRISNKSCHTFTQHWLGR